MLQGIGKTKPIMYIGVLRNCINIILDWLLIFGHLGFPRMNLEGAAIATTISNLIAGPVLLGFVVLSPKLPFKLSFMRIFKARWEHYLDIINIGIPAGLETLLWHTGNLFLLRFLNSLDKMAAGIYSLIFAIEIIPFLIYSGLAQANTTLVGQKSGAGDFPGVKKVGFQSMVFSYIICIICMVVFILFPRSLLSIFSNDPDLINRAIPFLIIVSITMFPRAINVVTGSGIRGLGDTRWMLYSQLFGTVYVVILSFIFIFMLQLNMNGMFIAILLDETTRAVINSIRFYKGWRILGFNRAGISSMVDL